MSTYLFMIAVAAAGTAVLSFWFVTREVRRGRIRRSPKMSMTKACIAVMRREDRP